MIDAARRPAARPSGRPVLGGPTARGGRRRPRDRAPRRPGRVRGHAGRTLPRLIGQQLMVAMDGTDAERRRSSPGSPRGEIGGRDPLRPEPDDEERPRRADGQLQRAATAAGQPRLLIAVDQEGGTIKRIPWAPPTLSPPQMGALASTPIARAQGLATGHGPEGARHQHRPRPDRRRPGRRPHRSCTGSAGRGRSAASHGPRPSPTPSPRASRPAA